MAEIDLSTDKWEKKVMTQQPHQRPQLHPNFEEGAMKVSTEGEQDERKIAIEAFNSYGAAAIKAVFLLNGAAILALLALLSAIAGKDAVKPLLDAKLLIRSMQPAFHFFIGGVATAAFASGLGYLNWSARVAQHWEPSHWATFVITGKAPVRPKRLGLIINGLRVLAILAYLASLGCFLRGAFMVSNAFRKVAL